jgi:hypothetical protein
VIFKATAIKKQDDKYSIENAMSIIYDKLGEANDDLKNGQVISEEEMWEVSVYHWTGDKIKDE